MELALSGLRRESAEALLQAVGRGDRQAFQNLYELTAKTVYAYALSILHDPQDAEDAMQETYLRIRGAAHMYEPQGKPLAWIFVITRNICMMQFRRESHWAEDPREERPDGLDRIGNLEDRLVLQTALRELSDQECRIVLLHAVSGLKHRQIAQALDLPLSTVLSKYSRGLKKLRKRLEEAP